MNVIMNSTAIIFQQKNNMKSLFIIFTFVFAFNISNLIAANNQDLYKKLDVFGDVFDLIKKNYVEKVDDEKVIEYAINGMLPRIINTIDVNSIKALSK